MGISLKILVLLLQAIACGGMTIPDVQTLSRRQGTGQSIGYGIQHDGSCDASQVNLLNFAAQDMQNMALAASRFDPSDPVRWSTSNALLRSLTKVDRCSRRGLVNTGLEWSPI